MYCAATNAFRKLSSIIKVANVMIPVAGSFNLKKKTPNAETG